MKKQTPAPSQRGYTLIEVMLTLALMAILASAALPSFSDALRKSRRSDALVSLAQIQGEQERLRSRSSRYGNLDEIGVASTSRSGHYTLQIVAFDADGYTALATAAGAQLRDESCRVLSVRAVNANVIYASGPDSSAANGDGANRQCWRS